MWMHVYNNYLKINKEEEKSEIINDRRNLHGQEILLYCSS
jgi:hypothetical protein